MNPDDDLPATVGAVEGLACVALCLLLAPFWIAGHALGTRLGMGR